MSPFTDIDSGPVDGEEIRMEIAPHHQKHSLKKEGNSLVKLAVTGAVVVGGIVGVYLLYKHFLSKGRRKMERRN